MHNGNGHFFEFQGFRLDAAKKVLWRGDEIVRITPKAVELLIALVERRGDVLTRDEMLETVWRGAFVEEANINFTISNLRKVFGAKGKEFIETIPRRGYRFAADVAVDRENYTSDLLVERQTISQIVVEEQEIAHTIVSEPTRSAEKRALTYVFSGALFLLAAAVGIWLLGSRSWTAAVGTPIRSIAVLPFKAIDDVSRNSNRGVGLADILITRLSGLKRVSVRPISSVADLSGTDDPSEIGKKLGVDAVLDGTIYQTPSDIRVTVRFISVADGRAIWSGEFEKPLRAELQLQSEIAMRVADGLSLNLDPEERRRLTKRYTDNREAYEAYLRGRFFYDKRDPEFDPKAIEQYEKAIALDPNYALAFAALADIYPVYAERIPEKRAGRYEHAKALLVKALALDEELPEAHTSLAWIKRIHDWDWEGSEREFKRALELDPNSYQAHMWYALLLITLNRKDEAMAQIEKAKELAPLTPSVVANYFTVLFFRQDNDRLLDVANEEKLLGGREYNWVRTHSQSYLRLRQYDKLIELVTGFSARNPERRWNLLTADLSAAYALKGDMARAEPLIAELRKTAKRSGEVSYRLALVLTDIGKYDEALKLLERSLAERDARLMWIAVEPRFAPLRGDPRFQTILTKMNLPSA